MDTPIEIHEVDDAEGIETVAGLARRIWTEHYVPMIEQAQVEYMLERFQSAAAITQQIGAGYEYYVARLQGREDGYFALVADAAESGLQISKIYVTRERRRSGIGAAILRFVEQRGAALRACAVWLTVNRHNSGSIAFYERMGFVKAGELVTEIGNGFVMDDYKMIKRLG